MYEKMSIRELYHERNKNRALGALFVLLLPMLGLGIERIARAVRIDKIIKQRSIEADEHESVVVICSGKSETKNDSNHSNV